MILTIAVVWAIYTLFFGESSGKLIGVSRDAARRRAWREWRPGKTNGASPSVSSGSKSLPGEVRKDMVVASMKEDDTFWLFEQFPAWHKSIYVADDSQAELTVPLNKGRESMVYLTYVPLLLTLPWIYTQKADKLAIS